MQTSTQQSLTREQKEAVGLLSIGTFLEYFDLMLYVHMAVLLNELFFPKTDPFTASLLAAFSFCSTYFLRPFGALIFGYIGDNIGRKHTVIITTFMMATSCIIMANLPTYSQIGITAAWIITICRIIQGMSSMGELTGAQLFLSETIKKPIRYPAVAMLCVAADVGSFAALGIASLVTIIGIDWRLAFWIGAIVAIIGVSARTKLRETPEFILAKNRIKNISNIHDISTELEELDRELLKQVKINKKTVVSLFFLDCMWPVCFYFAYVHCASILKYSFNYTPEQIIHHNLIVSIAQLIGSCVFVKLLYKILPLILFKVLWIFSFCLFLCSGYLLTNINSANTLLIIQCAIVLLACDVAPISSVLYKHFPVLKRFTYVAFIYALSRAATYVITSVCFVFFSNWLGNSGICPVIIIVPIFIAYYFGLKHFEHLEKTVSWYE